MKSMGHFSGHLHKMWEIVEMHSSLYPVGGWTSQSEKYARQIGSFFQGGVKIRNIWNHHPDTVQID